MKILLSAFACEPGRGSEDGHGWNWAYNLAVAGHQVHVITRPAGNLAISAFLNLTSVPGLKIVYVDSPHVCRVFGQFRTLLESLLWQRRALAIARNLDVNVDFDVVHHVTWGSLHVGSKLWKLGKPFVFGPVGGGQVAPRGFGRYLRGGWVVELMRSLFVRYLTGVLLNAKSTVTRAELVLVTNYETWKWVELLGGTRIEFMMDVGISKTMFAEPSERLPIDSNCIRILWVGRLLPRKGVLLALEALAGVDSTVNFKCTIVGDGRQGRYLPTWIQQFGLTDRVTWRGQMRWDEVMDAYLRHDVFLFTSLRDTAGSQLIEAMARGCAMVILDHHGAGAIVPSSAGVKIPVTTPSETVAALTRGLERLARDPKLISAMGQSAIEFARQHTWEHKIAQAIALYPFRHSTIAR